MATPKKSTSTRSKTTDAPVAPASVAAPKAVKAAKPAVAEITDDMIAKRAFEIWCGKGRPWGGEQENWKQAQAELAAELGFASKSAKGSRADARS